MVLRNTLMGVLAVALSTAAVADDHAGDKPEVEIVNEMVFPEDAMWKHSFDAYEAETGQENAALKRALGFSKAMEAQGVGPDRVKVAVVIHGPSVFDVATDERYGEKHYGLENPNKAIIAELIERGAEIWVCGFAAKYHGVGNVHLLEGVKMAPTGTVAHAELQRRGFGINPY